MQLQYLFRYLELLAIFHFTNQNSMALNFQSILRIQNIKTTTFKTRVRNQYLAVYIIKFLILFANLVLMYLQNLVSDMVKEGEVTLISWIVCHSFQIQKLFCSNFCLLIHIIEWYFQGNRKCEITVSWSQVRQVSSNCYQGLRKGC